MSKKLLKYGKFLLSMALVFCMVLPSYATLSATDGSSFVTKAEFDSALADFNSRLTTFEAGINSKIDSQVTSYLDRNGIWQAKEQKPLLNTETEKFGFTAVANSTGYCYNGQDALSKVGVTAGPISVIGKDSVTNIVNKFDKSGLCCVEYYHDVKDDGYLCMFFGKQSTAGQINQDFIAWNFTQQWSFYSDGELKNSLVNYMNVAYPGSLSLPAMQNGRLLFFVKKDANLYEKNEYFEYKSTSNQPFSYALTTTTYLKNIKVSVY